MKILSIIGARPQFVKAAVFRKHCYENGIKEILLNTGQHYDTVMSNGIFDELNVLDADYNFTIQKRSHAAMTAEMMVNIEEVVYQEKPDFVNVYGDTNSTLAGALVASKLNIPIVHIEAGLRSFNKFMPEEKNRILTDHVSTILLCPTKVSVTNLQQEGIVDNIHHVGDIMYDAIKTFSHLFKFPKNLQVENKPLALVTIHRAENLLNAKSLSAMIEYLRAFTSNYQLIFPIHPNTKHHLDTYNIDHEFLTLIEPLGYTEMQGLLSSVDLVLTDSGGLQKEAYFHKKDCITLRNETEWTETVESGWNMLWTCENREEKREIKEYGNGNFCSTALKIITDYWNDIGISK